MLINRLSTHASDRIATAYNKPVHTQKIIAVVERCSQQGYVVNAKDKGHYVVHPDHGAYVVVDGVVATFIHKSRIGEHGGCQRAYIQVMEKFNKKAA